MNHKQLSKRWRNHAQARREINLLLVADAYEQCAQDLNHAMDKPVEFVCPIPELKGMVPLVLYFKNNQDADEFTALVREAKPNMVCKSL